MDRFAALRERNRTSKQRSETAQEEIIYDDFDPMSSRFENAWTREPENIPSAYSTFGEVASRPQEPDSIYEDMTFNPRSGSSSSSDDNADYSEVRLRKGCRSLPRELSSERPTSLNLSVTNPPIYKSFMSRLSVSENKKSKSLPRKMNSSGSPHSLPRNLSLSDRIPDSERNVINPLFTPSPVGSPCGSPSLGSSPLAQQLARDEEDIYDAPTPRPDTPPVLPPKKKSLSLKLRKKITLERSASSDSETSYTRRARQSSLSDKTPVPRESPTPVNGAPLGEQYVGYMIEMSSKSNKMEKKLSRKSKKRESGATQEKEREERVEVDEVLRIRSSSLATKDDWDEIDSMMLELQCDITHTQQTIRRPSRNIETQDKSLEEWLVKIDMAEVQAMFELHGWDNVDFISGTITRDDLTAMGITNDKLKRKLIRLAEEDLVNFHHGSVPGTVDEWLSSLNLKKYLNKFLSQRMGSMSRVLEIWEVELTSILNIEPIGHRKRIMKSIRDLRNLQSSFDEAEKKARGKKKCNEEKSPQPKWLHTHEDMVRGVDYAVRYYGCVKITGPESTKQSALICEKQQSKIKSDQKVPEFRLRISASGVEFIDKMTHQSSCQYHIEDISFVSRDKSNLLLFSFVTTDRKIGIKMCHVFKSHSRNQAYEACSTIAQSFEVAFKLREEKRNLNA